RHDAERRRRDTVAAPALSCRNGRDIGSAEKFCQAAPGLRPAHLYFGCTFGSPPGLPGGGMTGVLPPPGGGAAISGSTLGGHTAPSLRATVPLRFLPLPVVLGLGLAGSMVPGGFVEGGSSREMAPGSQGF